MSEFTPLDGIAYFEENNSLIKLVLRKVHVTIWISWQFSHIFLILVFMLYVHYVWYRYPQCLWKISINQKWINEENFLCKAMFSKYLFPIFYKLCTVLMTWCHTFIMTWHLGSGNFLKSLVHYALVRFQT